MSCCHKHQQQRYHNENTKIYSSYVVHIFQRVTTNYQTLQTWIGHDATRYHNFYMLPHALACIFSQFNMARLQCNALP